MSLDNQKAVSFSEAMTKVGAFFDNSANHNELEEIILVVRDINGRFRLIANADNINKNILEKIEALAISLKEYASTPFLQFRAELYNSQDIFESDSIVEYVADGSDKGFKLLDRTITGSGWTNLHLSLSETTKKTPKIAFYGLKGGVGRSTALTLLSYRLASQGKNVFLLDLDLESPGLSSLILPEENKLEFGVVDWIVEKGYARDSLLENSICESPIANNCDGTIKVLPAIGKYRSSYMDKLARVYNEAKGIGFNEKLADLINAITDLHAPDIILIDSRSGLHDLAALSIVGVADYTLLFGIDSDQSWQGYEILFSHWKNRTNVARFIREKLKIVHSMMPEDDQLNRKNIFLQKSYDLFSEYLYDEIEPDYSESIDVSKIDLFGFNMNENHAPHYPLKILWNARLQEFNPLLLNNGMISTTFINTIFEDLFNWVDQNLFITSEQK